MTTQQSHASNEITKRYSLTINPMIHRDGWDIFGELVNVRTVSTGMRVEGGELVALDITTDSAGHEHVSDVLESDDGVIEFTA